MAMKQLAQRLQPLPLYFILGLTVCLFFLELVIAHVTHSLTLLVDAYHALCNIIVLVGSIISIKHGSGRSDNDSFATNSHEELKSLASLPNKPQMCCASQPGPERQLRNTFGWARVDVVVMLIGCVFLSSLCFSVVVEAAQTLIHISHHDEMHAPIPVLVIGVLAMFLNLLAYLLIGGYTFHQGSFLSSLPVAAGELPCQLTKEPPQSSSKRQGLWGLSRDCVGCVIVIICAIIVYSTKPMVAKFVDPAFSILSAVLVLFLSYPFMKESCLILLQTIPDHIDISSLCTQLVSAFPDIVNVHELHVWMLTADKTYCTAHIIFLNPKEYSRITDDISRFFVGKGITHVTIQPEFYKDYAKADLVSSASDCLVQCTEDLCMERHCCASRTPSLESVHVDSHSHKLKGSTKSRSPSSKCESSNSNSTSASKQQGVATTCASQLSKADKIPEPLSSGDESPPVDIKSDLVKREMSREVKIVAAKKPTVNRQTKAICENHPAPKVTSENHPAPKVTSENHSASKPSVESNEVTFREVKRETSDV